MITMETNITGGDTVFNDRVKTSDLESRAQVLNNLHGRMIFGPFEFFPHGGTLWKGNRAVIFFGPVPSSNGNLYQGYLPRLQALKGSWHGRSRITTDRGGRI